MTTPQCETCRFWGRIWRKQRGRCGIALPPWVATIDEDACGDIGYRDTYATDTCDLYRVKEVP